MKGTKSLLVDIKKGTRKEVNLKQRPVLLAYGTCNVYQINNKAYYQDIINTRLYVRAEEQDYLIKKSKETLKEINAILGIKEIPDEVIKQFS